MMVTEKYTVEDLSLAFDTVKDKDHWKGPVAALIPTSKRDVTAAAIEFYTATKMKVHATHLINGDAYLVISAAGYWNGPAN